MNSAGSDTATGEARLRLLRWKCRRGMKELDILLDTFVRTNEAGLAAGDWPEFESLLALEDDELWDCLRDPEQHGQSTFQSLAAAVRDSTRQDA